jgi:hypothetical protein
VNATYAEGTITSAGGAAYGGALNPLPTQHHTDGADGIPAPPPGLTITVLNKHSVAVSTTHARNPEAPAATSGYFDPGTIDVGQGAIFAVPTNWAGRVAVAEAKNGPLTDGRDVSLIEANFLYSDAYGVAVADVDISFVYVFYLLSLTSCASLSRR